MTIPIGRVIRPPNRTTLSQLSLNLLDLLPCPHPGRRIVMLLSASFRSPSCHEFLYQGLTLAREQGRIRTAPQTITYDKVAAIRRDGIIFLQRKHVGNSTSPLAYCWGAPVRSLAASEAKQAGDPSEKAA